MTFPAHQPAFVAGEISPRLFGRSDLERYFLGAASCLNFWVDYRGGLTFRPGTAFGDWVEGEARLIPFSFSIEEPDSYLLVFGGGKIRFIQSGGYVLEAEVTATAVINASPGVVTAASHGFSDGDWVFSAGGGADYNLRTFQVKNPTTNTFELYDVDGTPIDTTSYATLVPPWGFSRVYTIASPYADEDLPTLNFDQDLNTLVLTHVDYDPRVLTRLDHTNWSFSIIDFEPTVAKPPQPTATASGTSGTAGVGFVVTAVKDGEESPPSTPRFLTSIDDYASIPGDVVLTNFGVADAKYYNVYRTTIVPDGGRLTHAEEFGLIGRCYGPVFLDPNIDADFSITPPELYLPFNDGQVLYIEITAGGSGYSTFGTTVTLTGGGGSGFVGRAVVNSGAVVHVIVLNPGSGYTSAPTVVFSGGGTGATATAELGPATGNKPGVSLFFQQRRVYAGTLQLPRTIFGSIPGFPYNLATSVEVRSTDSYTYELDSRLLSPIRHLVRSGRGLLIFTASETWEMRGQDDGTITPLGAAIEEQIFLGATIAKPIKIGTTVLYSAERGTSIQGLRYNQTLRAFQSEDLSILANHLFSPSTQVEEWGYIGEPAKTVLAQTSHNLVYAFTYSEAENVKGWAQTQTRGLFKSLAVVKEDQVDTAYIIAERVIGGKTRNVFERWQPQTIVEDAEDGWFLDCAIQNILIKPAASVTPSGTTGSVTLTASAAVFSSADVGKIFRGGGGRGRVTAYISPTQLTMFLTKDITYVIPQVLTPRRIAQNAWTLDPEVTTFSGLWAFEGHTVRPFIDGQVQPDQVVENGQITLQVPGSKALIGLPYRGVVKTLPVDFENETQSYRRIAVKEAVLRMDRTAGLKVGPSLDDLQYLRDRTDETYNEATRLRSNVAILPVDGGFEFGPGVYIVQDAPLPATLLALTNIMDLGDDKG